MGHYVRTVTLADGGKGKVHGVRLKRVDYRTRDYSEDEVCVDHTVIPRLRKTQATASIMEIAAHALTAHPEGDERHSWRGDT